MDVALAVEVPALDDDDGPGVVSGGVADLFEHRPVPAGQRVQEVRDGLSLDDDPVREDVIAHRERLQSRLDAVACREVTGDSRVQFSLVGDDFDAFALVAGVRDGAVALIRVVCQRFAVVHRLAGKGIESGLSAVGAGSRFGVGGCIAGRLSARRPPAAFGVLVVLETGLVQLSGEFPGDAFELV